MNGNSAIYAAMEVLVMAWPMLLIGHLLFSWIMARIARRRNLSGWPLAWIPVMNLWVMGDICDQYQYVVHGKKSRSRVWLPVSAGLTEMLLILGALGLQRGYGFVPALWATLLDVMAIVAIVRFYCGLYWLYCSCVPRRAVAYLIWSICVAPLTVVFLLIVKNRELGMPTRRGTFHDQEDKTLKESISAADEEETAPEEELTASGMGEPVSEREDTIEEESYLNGEEVKRHG